jgi:hypothetical protein
MEQQYTIFLRKSNCYLAFIATGIAMQYAHLPTKPVIINVYR